MRKITEIYKEYKIMPSLGAHQLRVASVARRICDALEMEVDKDNITSACLLHDMGNIIKSDLSYFPTFVEPEGIMYWQGVKDEYIKKYGDNEDVARDKIAIELGVNDVIRDTMNSLGYKNVEKVFKAEDFNKKICTYADFRVGPHGVLSLEDRISEGALRYAKKVSKTNPEVREIQRQYMRDLEKQIFACSKIKPEDITDASIAPYIEKLKNFEI